MNQILFIVSSLLNIRCHVKRNYSRSALLFVNQSVTVQGAEVGAVSQLCRGDLLDFLTIILISLNFVRRLCSSEACSSLQLLYRAVWWHQCQQVRWLMRVNQGQDGIKMYFLQQQTTCAHAETGIILK